MRGNCTKRYSEEFKRLRKLGADQAGTVEVPKEVTTFFAKESDR
ncbi:hypothetical protein AB0M68_30705 [Streptomyces sp. NPDC051453]